MAGRSTVGPKGQITIPKDLRERYHLLEGEDVVVLPADEGVLVKHFPNSLRGRLKGKMATDSIEKEMDAVRKEWRLQQVPTQRVRSRLRGTSRTTSPARRTKRSAGVSRTKESWPH